MNHGDTVALSYTLFLSETLCPCAPVVIFYPI
jgi:hypothetical protein